jgi:sugar O-acyltransferase (sialic acid O-acetyltransferase NeuD family)
MTGTAAHPSAAKAIAPICLFGAGEHARVVAEAARLAGATVAGCWATKADPGLDHLGKDADLERELEKWRGHRFHLALAGQPGCGHRHALWERWRDRGLNWATIIHPTAFVSPSAHVGDGVFIGPGAVVHAGATLAAQAIVNSGCIVEHDTFIGEGAVLAPGALCGGGACLGAWAWCGLGAIIRDHAAVGDGAIVGMGAVVVADVAAGTTVMGVPARARTKP